MKQLTEAQHTLISTALEHAVHAVSDQLTTVMDPSVQKELAERKGEYLDLLHDLSTPDPLDEIIAEVAYKHNHPDYSTSDVCESILDALRIIGMRIK